jgi:chromosome segregation ATPase
VKITADILEQAREALADLQAQKVTLLAAIKEQGRKITDLEREVQRQMTAREAAEQALRAARVEIDALRTQIPTERAQQAFETLTQFLAAPSEIYPELRVAA